MHRRQLAAWQGKAASPALAQARACRGEYQADRQPGAWQCTTRCPGPCSRSATAGPQSHGIQATMTRPGPTRGRARSAPGNTTMGAAALPQHN
jgi:hypothetical protein